MPRTIVRIIFSCALLIVNSLYAQRSGIWYFGKNAGLRFEEIQTVASSESAMDGNGNYYYCPAIQMDKEGNVLFYSDGVTVWTKDHTVMSHGVDLHGSGSGQTTLIVPKPGSDNNYFLFTLERESPSNGSYNLYAHEISMNETEGVVIHPNNKLLGNLAAKLTAIPHSNGIDYWILCHELGSANFQIALLTQTGINSFVSQSIGQVHDHISNNVSQGYIKPSPDGKYLAEAISAAVFSPLNLFSFDNTSGELMNYTPLQSPGIPYGISFSPNNDFLYVSFRSIFSTDLQEQYNAIYQWDVSVNDSAKINYSRKGLIAGNKNTNIDITKPKGGPDAFSLQLAPDGKIYSGYSWLTPQALSNQNALLVIEKPNVGGYDCDINLREFAFRENAIGPQLPNLIESNFNGIESTSVCADRANMVVTPNPSYDRFIVKLPEGCDLLFDLQIVNALGQTILIQRQLVSGIAIDLSQQADGLYYFLISTRYYKTTHRLVKIN